MHVDRSRFLALTTALAAGACTAAPPPPVGQRSPMVSVRNDAAQPAAPAGAPLADAGQLPGEPARTGPPSPSSDPAQDAGSAADFDQRFDRLLVDLVRSRGKCVRPEPPQPPWALRMEEKPPLVIGSAQRCDRLREPPGPHCEDFPLVFNDCIAAVSPLKPKPAEQAMRCLERKSGSRALCGKQRAVARCVRQAWQRVRPDQSTAALCSELERHCRQHPELAGTLATADCQQYLSALRCWHVEEASHCLAGTCSVDQCVQPTW